ncbi:MAG: hypothetical protein AAFV29_25280, partial [Myxococcota bacterium]
MPSHGLKFGKAAWMLGFGGRPLVTGDSVGMVVRSCAPGPSALELRWVKGPLIWARHRRVGAF